MANSLFNTLQRSNCILGGKYALSTSNPTCSNYKHCRKIDSIAKHSSSISSLSYFAPTAGILPLATDTISLQYSLANNFKDKTLDTLSGYKVVAEIRRNRDEMMMMTVCVMKMIDRRLTGSYY